jgi:hypothetical protein
MDYVRSSRELYQNIHSGKMGEGDYLLVAEKHLPAAAEEALPGKLWPAPAPPWFEHVLSVKAETKVQLFRVMPGAVQLQVPPTPEPEKLNWRDMQFDTD